MGRLYFLGKYWGLEKRSSTVPTESGGHRLFAGLVHTGDGRQKDFPRARGAPWSLNPEADTQPGDLLRVRFLAEVEKIEGKPLMLEDEEDPSAPTSTCGLLGVLLHRGLPRMSGHAFRNAKTRPF